MFSSVSCIVLCKVFASGVLHTTCCFKVDVIFNMQLTCPNVTSETLKFSKYKMYPSVVALLFPQEKRSYHAFSSIYFILPA